ncbi:MAG: Trm112 family protein [Propionibacteriaceae bacterium]|nr:Trm112 family protein [Propionibacteriaceae bacterium]
MTEALMDLSAEFLAIAACPACHAKFAVDYDKAELVCTASTCGLAYPVQDRIPVLVIDQARSTL